METTPVYIKGGEVTSFGVAGPGRIGVWSVHSTHTSMPMVCEIAVFYNGMNFEERVGLHGAMESTKASMRSVLNRGTSNPI